MASKKALYISQEIHPYLPSTPMAEISKKVPQAMQERRYEVRTFMPKYGCINERRNQLHEVIRLSGLNIVIDDADHPLFIKVATLQPTRMQVYFIDNDDFFHHHASTELETVTHPDDNDERIIFFALGVLETVKKLRWYPEIIHCNGWVTALAPMLIRTKYADDPAVKDSKIVFSLFSDNLPKDLDERMAEKLEMAGIPREALKAIDNGAVTYQDINKIGIDYADAVVQAMEDVDPELIAYAKASGKPFLPYPGEENYQAYADFYDSLL